MIEMTIPVTCPEPGCAGIAHVPQSFYDEHDVLVGLECSTGHHFDHEKLVCPRCGSRVTPAEYRPQQAWSGDVAPDRHPVFRPAECTAQDCDWQGPRELR